MSDSNKDLIKDPRWGPDTKTDWPTDRRSQNNLNPKDLYRSELLQVELNDLPQHIFLRCCVSPLLTAQPAVALLVPLRVASELNAALYYRAEYSGYRPAMDTVTFNFIKGNTRCKLLSAYVCGYTRYKHYRRLMLMSRQGCKGNGKCIGAHPA
jgi:hypothetical protein